MPAAGEWFREAFDDVYLSVYRHRDAGEAARFASWAADRLGLRGARVLDLACGAARFAEPVRRAGGRYLGLDLSRPLLDAARGNDASLDLVRADMRYLPLRDGCCDVVLSMFTSFGYFEDDAENRAVLGGAARVLRPGGRMLIDHMHAARVRETLVPSSERESGGARIRERRAIHHGRVVKDVEIALASGEAKRYCESVRLLEEATLIDWASTTGLRHLETWGDYDGGPFTRDAERMLIAFERGGR